MVQAYKCPNLRTQSKTGWLSGTQYTFTCSAYNTTLDHQYVATVCQCKNKCNGYYQYQTCNVYNEYGIVNSRY